MPLLTIAILALNPRFSYRMEIHYERVLPLFFSAIYYYIGYYLLRNLSIYPIFKVFLIASVLVIVVLLLISFRWKISAHMAGIGSITGIILAISFRMGVNPVFIIAGLFLVAGLVGSARLYLGKHNLLQIVSGYLMGLIILFVSVYYV